MKVNISLEHDIEDTALIVAETIHPFNVCCPRQQRWRHRISRGGCGIVER